MHLQGITVVFRLCSYPSQQITVKPVLSGHSKIDKPKVIKTNGSLMKVEIIEDCSLAIIGLENSFFWSSLGVATLDWLYCMVIVGRLPGWQSVPIVILYILEILIPEFLVQTVYLSVPEI